MTQFPRYQADEEAQKLPRRKRKDLEQRREILQAALSLFAQKGYHNVSMQEVAKEAEFGIGTLYKYFPNKESLYTLLLLDVAEKFHGASMEALEEEPDPYKAVIKYAGVHRRLFSDNFARSPLVFC